MSLLSRLLEKLKFRDDTRDQLCTALKDLGLDAQMAARGRVEQKIYFGPRWSLGVIDIAEGPIRWVNVTQETITWGGEDPPLLHFVVYGVPDPRVGPGFPKVRVKITGVRWKGKDFGLGIVDRLSQDVSVASAIMDGAINPFLNVMWPRAVPRVEIRAYPYRSCWMLATPTLAPSKQEWDCYQAIARHLLATPIPTGE